MSLKRKTIEDIFSFFRVNENDAKNLQTSDTMKAKGGFKLGIEHGLQTESHFISHINITERWIGGEFESSHVPQMKSCVVFYYALLLNLHLTLHFCLYS